MLIGPKSDGISPSLKNRIICPECGHKSDLFGKGGGEKAAKDFQIPLLGQIPLDPNITITSDSGVPFVIKYQDSPAASAFTESVKKIRQILKK